VERKDELVGLAGKEEIFATAPDSGEGGNRPGGPSAGAAAAGVSEAAGVSVTDQELYGAVLRRMLNTPPKP